MKDLRRSFKGMRKSTFARTLQTFKPALQGQLRGLLAGVLLGLVIAGLEVLRPWPVKFVFDGVLKPIFKGKTASPPLALTPGQLLILASLAIPLLAFLTGSLRVWQTLALGQVGRRISTRIRRQVFEHLHRLAFPFHQSAHSGDLLVRVIGDVNKVRDLVYQAWVSLLGRCLLLLGSLGVMLVLDPLMTLLALLPLPLMTLDIFHSGKKLAKETRNQRRREGGTASIAADSFRQIRVVKAYAREEETARSFARSARSGERAGLRAKRIVARMGRLSESLTGLGLAGVLYIGSQRVLSGNLTPGELLVFLSYTRSLYKPLRGFAKDGARLSKASACAERLLEVLDIEPEPRGEGKPAPPFRGEIRLEGVNYTWPMGAHALQGLSLKIPAGALVLVKGPNGSGKSTLLSLLLRLVSPDQGRLLLDGEEASSFELKSYRECFAYVPQEIQLFAASLKENIIYGRPDASEERLQTALDEALLLSLVDRSPEGLETPVGEGGTTLSGGEARRVMLARAAVRDASILLLDEPLAGLDREARGEVARSLRRVATGRTAIVISHGDAREIDPDLVIELKEGRLDGIKTRSLPGAPVP